MSEHVRNEKNPYQMVAGSCVDSRRRREVGERQGHWRIDRADTLYWLEAPVHMASKEVYSFCALSIGPVKWTCLN